MLMGAVVVVGAFIAQYLLTNERSRYQLGTWPDAGALLDARGPKVSGDSPGQLRHFWLPLQAMSMPQSSRNRGRRPDW